MKKIASGLGALALAGFAASFALSPGTAPKTERVAKPVASFHGPERVGIPAPKADPACSECHKPAPHAANGRDRAFLNQHAGFMACAVCHATGSGIVLKREGDGSRITATAGGAPLGKPTVSGRLHALTGASFAANPGGCRSCHARGSRFFSDARFYDDYRRGLLEDLDVLSLLENAR